MYPIIDQFFLTSLFGKLLERVVQKQMLDYLLINKLISPHQHGFLSELSTCILSCWKQLMTGHCLCEIVMTGHCLCEIIMLLMLCTLTSVKPLILLVM